MQGLVVAEVVFEGVLVGRLGDCWECLVWRWYRMAKGRVGREW